MFRERWLLLYPSFFTQQKAKSKDEFQTETQACYIVFSPGTSGTHDITWGRAKGEGTWLNQQSKGNLLEKETESLLDKTLTPGKLKFGQEHLPYATKHGAVYPASA